MKSDQWNIHCILKTTNLSVPIKENVDAEEEILCNANIMFRSWQSLGRRWWNVLAKSENWPEL